MNVIRDKLGTNEERKSTMEIVITDVLTHKKIDYLLCECTIFPPFEVHA